MGSVAYKLARVACGLADATWTLVPKHEWDVAAGVALDPGGGRMGQEPPGRIPAVQPSLIRGSRASLRQGLVWPTA